MNILKNNGYNMNKLLNIMMCLSLGALLAACSNDDNGTEATASAVPPAATTLFIVDTTPFPQSGNTRAMPTGDDDDMFTIGDTIALWVVKDGAVTKANVPLVCDGRFWIASGVAFDNTATYYAMFPYLSDDSIVSLTKADTITTAVDPAVTDETAFFDKVISSWKPLTNQSSLSSYTASDLMVAKSIISTETEGAITLTMRHRMAMGMITVPGSSVRAVAKTKDGNYPLYWAGKYRMIVKPATATDILFQRKTSTTTDTVTVTLNIGQPGHYKVYDVTTE